MEKCIICGKPKFKFLTGKYCYKCFRENLKETNGKGEKINGKKSPLEQILSAVVMMVLIFGVYSCVTTPNKPTASLDGTAVAVKTYLKENALDPRSLKIDGSSNIVETSDKGIYIQTVGYRLKNTFGGYVYKEATFYIMADNGNGVVIDVANH